MGNKAELLVTIHLDEGKSGPVTVELTTDLAADAVIHWGVRKGGKGDWLLPDKSLLPEGSSFPETGTAVDTPLKGCTAEECLIEIGGNKVQLQRITLQIPAGHDLSGLVFVVRSADSTMWWRDGEYTPQSCALF